jgi:hypothetical protein
MAACGIDKLARRRWLAPTLGGFATALLLPSALLIE